MTHPFRSKRRPTIRWMPFANGAYETKLNNAVVDALESHYSMVDQALRHEKVFKGLANLLVAEVYRQLREPVSAHATR